MQSAKFSPSKDEGFTVEDPTAASKCVSAEVVSIVDVLTNLTTEKVNLSKLHVMEPTWFVSSEMLIGN